VLMRRSRSMIRRGRVLWSGAEPTGPGVAATHLNGGRSCGEDLGGIDFLIEARNQTEFFSRRPLHEQRAAILTFGLTSRAANIEKTRELKPLGDTASG